MRKKLLIGLFFFLLIIPVAFGIGISFAEIRLRFFAPRRVSLNIPAAKVEQKEAVSTNFSEQPDLSIDISKLEQDQVGTEIKPKDPEKAVSDEQNSTNDQEKLKFALIGDSQYFNPQNPQGSFQKTVRFIKDQNVDAAFTMGDNISSCDGDGKCESKMNEWKNVLGLLFPKTYATMGNHDRTGKEKSDALWQRFFNYPTSGPAGFSELAYSFNIKNSHFVMLNSESPDEHVVNAAQRSWLQKDFDLNKQQNTFVFFHEPAYPVSSKIGESLDARSGERDALWNILSSHNVTAVFNGHEHIVSRRKIGNVYQFVFGNTDSSSHDPPRPGMTEYSYVGLSFGMVEVSGKEIKISTYSTDGELLNVFDLNKYFF